LLEASRDTAADSDLERTRAGFERNLNPGRSERGKPW
jgi:hypothetical protein